MTTVPSLQLTILAFATMDVDHHGVAVDVGRLYVQGLGQSKTAGIDGEKKHLSTVTENRRALQLGGIREISAGEVWFCREAANLEIRMEQTTEKSRFYVPPGGGEVYPRPKMERLRG